MDKRESGDGEENTKEMKGAIGGNDQTKSQANKVTSLDWKVNEQLLKELMDLGIDKNTAMKSLYHTANDSIEKAFDFIFQNANPIELSKTTLEEELGIEILNTLCKEVNLDEAFHSLNEDFKMVFVLNTSLNMSLGKCCAQTAHAALAIIKRLIDDFQNVSNVPIDRYFDGYRKWTINGETKIVLAGESTQHLEQLKAQADSLNKTLSEIIQDAGRTEIEPGKMNY